MGCCNSQPNNEGKGCCNRNGREIPEGIEPCCSIQGPRCMCMPYNDGWVIASIVLAIVATFFAWMCMPVFILSLVVGLGFFQLLWGCRSSRCMVYGFVSAALFVSLFSLAVGIYVLVAFRYQTECWSWCFEAFGDKRQYSRWDQCYEPFMATMTFACSALWFASAGCLFWFVKSGRHAKWERRHSKKTRRRTRSKPTEEPEPEAQEERE